MKIAVNKCYGGFGLSKEAIMKYAEYNNIELYSEDDGIITYYRRVPIEEYKKARDGDNKIKNWKISNNLTFSERNIERNDPILIKVIEELGEAANGRFANIEITEIPDNVSWEIQEYDGQERIAEAHRTW
jgi:hypothetical protein